MGRFLLLVLSAVFSLLLGEFGLRCSAHLDNLNKERDFKLVGSSRAEELKGTVIELGKAIRRSPNSRIVYEFLPNLDVGYQGIHLRTNSAGFRGDEIAAKKANTIRIFGVGDSYMFGWRVEADEHYLAVCTELLNRYFPNYSWEFINSAVPGYNVVMAVESLKEKGLIHEPDIVVYGFVANDTLLPNFLSRHPDVFDLRTSFLYERFASENFGKPISSELDMTPTDFLNSEREDVPAEYRYLAGRTAFNGAIEQFKEMRERHRFTAVIFADSIHPSLVEECLEKGFRVHKVDKFMAQVAQDMELENWLVPPLTFGEGDIHPSALGHKIRGYLLVEACIKELARERDEFRRSVASGVLDVLRGELAEELTRVSIPQ